MRAAVTNVESVEPLSAESRRRRKFSAEYKLHVVRRAEESKACRGVASLLRAEGLAASHLAQWRKQVERGQLTSLESKRSLKLASQTHHGSWEQQEKELTKWKRRAERAERLVALQKASLLASFETGAKMNAVIEAARRSAAEVGVAAACAALGIPRATYYRALARKRERSAAGRRAPLNEHCYG